MEGWAVIHRSHGDVSSPQTPPQREKVFRLWRPSLTVFPLAKSKEKETNFLTLSLDCESVRCMVYGLISYPIWTKTEVSHDLSAEWKTYSSFFLSFIAVIYWVATKGKGWDNHFTNPHVSGEIRVLSSFKSRFSPLPSLPPFFFLSRNHLSP
jgi:hypothetical protein